LLLGIALVLAAASDSARHASLIVAAALLGALAWSGHAAGTIGAQGLLHLTADVLHLLAAGAWVGALVPLALLLAAARRSTDPRWSAFASEATRRFSVLGIASVGTLIATGAVNAWILVGSLGALVATDYGRLLLVKVALFVAMLSLAAVNRTRLTPRLAQQGANSAPREALGGLTRNSTIELALGLAVLLLVGALGTVHPAPP
jgi:putative copper resistance protein D